MTDTVASDAVVVALGNRFRGDDAAGPLVADRLRERLPAPPAGPAIVEGALDATAILAACEGRSRAVVVDAAATGAAPGTVHRLTGGESLLPRALARCSSHGGGLAEAVALGAALGRAMPALTVIAVEGAAFDHGVPPSPEVADALDAVTAEVLAAVDGAGGPDGARSP